MNLMLICVCLTIAKNNDDNFQKLMEFFGSVREGFPKKQRLHLQFYLRTPEDGVFQRAAVIIRTTGGLCHKLVADQVAPFFAGTLIIPQVCFKAYFPLMFRLCVCRV